MANKVITRSHYIKADDRQETRFYELKNGHYHKLDGDALKKHIKANYEEYNFNDLPKPLQSYVKQIEGGKKRAKKAVRIDGKFLPQNFTDGRNPDNWKQLAVDKGYNGDVQAMFDNDEALLKLARKSYNSKQGLPYIYYSDNIIHYIDIWGGKLFVNGKQVSKIKAMALVDEKDKELKRKFGSFMNEFECTHKRGYTELHIKLPSGKQIDRCDDVDDFNDLDTGVQIIASDTEERKVRREIKKLDEKEVERGEKKLYMYEYKGKLPNGKKWRTTVGKLEARSITEAKHFAKAVIGQSGILIYVKRLFKNS